MKKILIILCLVSMATAYSQDRILSKALVLNAGIGGNINTPLNKNIWEKKMKPEINFSLDFRSQFKKNEMEDGYYRFRVPTWWGIGVGIGISHYRNSSSLKDSIDNADTLTRYIDKDKDFCKINIQYNDVKESVSLTYLDIPLYIEFGKPSMKKVSGFCKAGIKTSFLISKKNTTRSGTYTSSGFYPEWNVTLDDVEVLGYYEKKLEEFNELDKISKFVLWGVISGGVNIPLYDYHKDKFARWILRVSAQIDGTITPISTKRDDSKEIIKGKQLYLNQINMFGDGSRIFSCGLSIGLIYCL